ncbi:hypothetical protein ACFQL7_20920 [Halocatena marina]|uniref:Terminase n=1 Tax=Halocatena marina TaxID=2934937 RepID=A0ABD5YVS9_9EURY|nr:hypothetical protein [Halocatena marina]
MELDSDILESFADQLDLEPETIEDRWTGRPDLIAEDIFRVRDEDTGELRDLELFEIQKKALHAYFYGDADTINNFKGRRIGYSFVYCLAFLLEGIFIPDSFYAIVSKKKDQADARIGDIQDFIDHAKVKIPAPTTNKGEIELWNGSGFKAYTGDPDGSRGQPSARSVMIDEMAFIEDQKGANRAYGAFLALGKNRKMVQISTPNLSNDLFLQTHNRGTPTGYDEDGNYVGVISIKQPTFLNADEIDINTPLHQQELVPARPNLNISRVEEDRAADPVGFGQEYLCQPALDEYRFFSAESIERAMGRGGKGDYSAGLGVPNTADLRAIGVDIGINRDDTVIQVFDHISDKRYHRFQQVITDDVLAEFGLRRPDRANADHISQYVASVYNQMDADIVVIDRTGPGETFDRQLTSRVGRAVIGFNFSDREQFNEMMGDMNSALRNDRVTLLPDERLEEEMTSVVKEKKRDGSLPTYTGKEESETGKDDTAMAAVLGAFPPGYAVSPGRNADQAQQPHATPDRGENLAPSPPSPPQAAHAVSAAHSSTTLNRRGGRSGRNSSRNYNLRHSRR